MSCSWICGFFAASGGRARRSGIAANGPGRNIRRQSGAVILLRRSPASIRPLWNSSARRGRQAGGLKMGHQRSVGAHHSVAGFTQQP